MSVLLMGTGRYVVGTPEDRLPSIPAVHNTLHDLHDVLIQHCGVDRHAVRVVEDPATSEDMGLAIVGAAERASELLLVYYIGHGLVSDGGRLFLASAQTDQDNLKLPFTALPYNDVRDLLMTRRTTVVVVLDCCFSGRAVGALGSPAALDTELARYDGGFVLAAAGRDQIALAPPGNKHTAFTGELIKLLRQGDQDGPEQITLDAAAKYLVRTLPAKGFPRPHRMGSAHTGDLVLAPNPAYRKGAAREPSTMLGAAPSQPVCPYPGLTAFQQHDAQWFFGRKPLIDKLVRTVAAALVAPRCTAVVGASGAGKSSLLRAGLLPVIARGALPVRGAENWPTAVITPAATPMRSLVEGLAGVAGWDPDAIWAQVARDPSRAVEAIRSLLAERGNRGGRLVLVVDQFEELFTRCQDRRERDRFVAVLTAAVGAAGSEPVALVVFGLRSGFYAQVAEYGELRTALQDGQVLVGSMTPEELTAAIRKPAEAVGLRVDPGLVELLIRDVGTAESAMRHDDTLPLLAHALRQTWEYRENRTLTVDGYLRTGGVSGALAKTAEAVYASLDATARRTAEHLLIRLIYLGESTRDTRRRLEIPALCAGLPDADHVLETLATARLVTVDGNIAQIMHDALISGWDRLRVTLDTDRPRLLESQKLDAEADRWERAERDPSFLLQGSRLAETRELFAAPDEPTNLTPSAEALLNESITWETAVARQARRRTRLVRSYFAVTAVLAVVTTTAVFWGTASYRTERQRLQFAASLQAAAASVALRTTQPHEAMLLAVAAWRIAPTPQARGAVLSTQSQPFTGQLPVHADRVKPVLGLATNPDNGLLAVATEHSIETWSIARRKLVAELPTDVIGTRLDFTSDGAFLVGADSEGTHVWDVRTGVANHGPLPELVRKSSSATVHPVDGSLTVSTEDAIHAVDPGSRTVIRTLPVSVGFLDHMAYTADGQTLAGVTDQDARIVLLDPATGAVRAASDTTRGVKHFVVGPHGSLIATANLDGAIQLWDSRTATLVTTLADHGATVTALAFSPDGRQLATSSADQTIRLWDVDARRQSGEPLTGHTGQVNAVAFGADNHTLITAGTEVVIWDVRHRPTSGHTGPVNVVVFQPGGRQLVTAGDDGVIRLWDVARPPPIRTLIGHTAVVRAAAFNPRGTLLTTAEDDGMLRTWDLETGHQITPPVAGPAQRVRAITYSPDESMLAAVLGEGTAIRLWEVGRTEWREFGLPVALDGAYRLSFSSDNSRLTVTGREFAATFHSQSGLQLGEPRSVRAPAGRSPAVPAGDGSAKVTVRDDQLVRLWDGRNQLQATLYGHSDMVLDAAFSDDRHTLATVSRDGALMIWDTNPDRVAIEVCQALHAELTPVQWREYIADLPYRTVCDGY